jgi:CHAT domain-containing protein
MTNPVSRHPGAETMAAFLEGTLAPGEVAEVAAHLRECADCRTVTGETARFEEEEAALAAAAARPRTAAKWRTWTVAAVAAIAAMAVPLLLRPANPIATLIDASPREYRRVEGRLSGFPWARWQGRPRTGATTTPPQAEHKLNSAAYAILDRTENDDAVKARHAAGVAHLLIDHPSASLEKLASAADDSKDPDVWNDLAAARYTVAVREGETTKLWSALAAVNRAIEIDPELPDAHFNRALILERLDREQARAAWKRYLELDPGSEWSTEARQRLAALGQPRSRLDIHDQLARAAGNPEALASLVRRFPQESRTAGESRLLGDWAEAYLGNGAARAGETLALVRAIGRELAAKHERLLLETVEAIDGAEDRAAVAGAIRSYAAARTAFEERDHEAADDGLRRAVAALRAVRSPLADVAEYYAAQCAYDNNRPAESTAMLLALRARLAPSHRALSAEIDLGLARNANTAADWGTAARFAARASATFTTLGESQRAAVAGAAEAIALERMGMVEPAWQRRMEAVGVLSDPHRIATILHSGALALAAADRSDEAIAVMDVAAQYESRAETQVAILMDRARCAERTGDAATAGRLLGVVRTKLGELSPKVREAREAHIDLTDAVLRRAVDPLGAIAALDTSIAFYERVDHGIRLPDAYLQRARAYRAAGRTDAALADYRAALRGIGEQQEKAGRESLSIEFLDVAAQTIDETVDLLLERGEIAAAFTVVDRAHAMVTSGYRLAGVPEGTAVLEYAVLPRSVVIFCVTRNGISAARVPVPRGALEARIASFVQKLQKREDVREAAASLYATLIAPVAHRIAGARELVIVPDRPLNALPFRALRDGSGYLIETYVMHVAPSAMAEQNAWPEVRPALHAVVIADPRTELASPLPLSRDEAKNVAAIRGATIIEGKDATRARVSAAIASSAIVHYAGHADSDASSYGALMLAPDGNDSGLLSASEIARLELRARPIVSLSACGTLRGQTTHVAGTPSVGRAFLDAGARAVVGTLWEIDDDVAAELFTRFHQRLRDGEVPAAALRTAQIEMLQTFDPRRSHPASWSAVEVLSNL